MDVDDALSVIIGRLRRSSDKYRNYGYDVYLPKLWEDYVRERDGLPATEYQRAAIHGPELSPVFYAAAWELCRRGVLRPGIRQVNEQVTQDGQAGNGYSFTPLGREFIDQVEELQFVPTVPGRIAAMFADFREEFGDGYHQRAQEAVKCYHGLAYLACCAMCGAAAESVLLAAAITRTGDEPRVLRTYRSAQGRSRIQNLLIGKAPGPLASRFRNLIELLSYWRDESSHGTASEISEIEAFDALGRLLRLSHLVSDQWDELTTVQ